MGRIERSGPLTAKQWRTPLTHTTVIGRTRFAPVSPPDLSSERDRDAPAAGDDTPHQHDALLSVGADRDDDEPAASRKAGQFEAAVLAHARPDVGAVDGVLIRPGT